MKSISAKDALQLWQKEGAISAKKAEELRIILEEKGDDHIGKGIVIFSTIGAILVGLGILLFIGSNWESMSPIIRLAVLFTGYGVICASAYISEQRGYNTVAESLWFLATIEFGANIFLIAQIYHFSLTFWQGPLLWLVGVLAMGHARRKNIYAWLAVPLFLLAVGWYAAGAGWFFSNQMEFLVSDNGLRPVLPSLGLGLIATALLLRKYNIWSYAAQSWIGWGVLLIAIPIVSMTADSQVIKEFFTMTFTLKQLIIICTGFLLAMVAIATNSVRSTDGKVVLLVTAIVLFFFTLQKNGQPLVGTIVHQNPAAFILYILFAFALALLSVWIGIRLLDKNLVNAGIASTSIIILIQYFSWSFEMLGSSIAFILGGIVLIGLSLFMEKTRRKILSQITPS